MTEKEARDRLETRGFVLLECHARFAGFTRDTRWDAIAHSQEGNRDAARFYVSALGRSRADSLDRLVAFVENGAPEK